MLISCGGVCISDAPASDPALPGPRSDRFATPARADDTDDSDASSWRSLTGQWWQWTLSTPADTNQVLDGSGAFCMVGQRGPVWFLGGTFTGQPTVRTCSVPDNVSLFFPVINRFTFNSPGCEQPDTDYSMAFMRSQIAPYIDGATGLSVLLDNRPETLATLAALRDMGAAVVLDDFGKEYSSLGYIKKLPIQAIKIDRSFIDGLPENEDDASIVRSVLSLAQSLELHVVAEGVETPAQLDFLVAQGCREFQGYLFSRPLSALDMTALLEQASPFDAL